MKNNYLKIFILATVTGLSACLFFCSIHFIPPYDKTLTTMIVIKKRIIEYAQANNKLPETLEQLPEKHGFENSIEDAWGKKILYSYETDTGNIVLKSCGEKNDCSCLSEEACIIVEFKLTR